MTFSFLSSNHLASQYAVVVLGLLLMGCKPIDKKDVTVTQKTEPDLTFTCVYEKDTLPLLIRKRIFGLNKRVSLKK